MTTYKRIYTRRLSIFVPIKEMKILRFVYFDIENINSMFLKTK